MEAEPVVPERVILNFTQRCNMRCQFCYVPFDGEAYDPRRALLVVDRLVDWGVQSVTFGGGDPMMYDFTPGLVARLRDRRSTMFFQMDTNGLRTDLRTLSMVDLVGLPIDAASKAMSTRMRKHVRHFAMVPQVALELARNGINYKINTVLSAVNEPEIFQIGEVVRAIGATRWSVYEFWSLGDQAIAASAEHTISAERFGELVQQLTATFTDILVEGGSIHTRLHAYFFVTPAGRAYTIDRDERGRYVELGNVLEDPDAVLQAWEVHADLEANSSRYHQRRR